MQIAIIGLGLIGGSLAKALKENTEHTVIGFDRDENTLLDALSLGAIDSVGSTSLLENADVVYVCLYLKKAALSRMCAASKIKSAAN